MDMVEGKARVIFGFANKKWNTEVYINFITVSKTSRSDACSMVFNVAM